MDFELPDNEIIFQELKKINDKLDVHSEELNTIKQFYKKLESKYNEHAKCVKKQSQEPRFIDIFLKYKHLSSALVFAIAGFGMILERIIKL